MAATRSGFCRIAAPAVWAVLAQTPLPAAAAQAEKSVLDEARVLIQAGRSAEARTLLAAHELAYAGQPDYDYLLGVAQLDSGRTGEAIATFGRMLAFDPAHAAARLEMGRAHYESGDRAAARRQFEWLMAQGPPPRIRDVAQAYLRAMAPRPDRRDGWVRSFEFGTGYDTNANAATDQRDFFGVTLDPESLATESGFAGLAFGVAGTSAVGSASRLRTAARLGHRFNEAASFVDQTLASLDLALDIGEGPTVFSLGTAAHYGLLDGEEHQWGASADLGLRRAIGGRWLAGGLLRYSVQRYDSGFGSLSTLDYDRAMLALSLWRSSDGGGFGFTATAGHDDPDSSGSPYENDRLGLQFDAVARNAGGNGLRLQFGYQEVDFDEDTPFFGLLERADELWHASVGGEIRDWPAREWNLLPRAAWVMNDSTISLYEYDRFEFGLTLQRTFR